MKWAANYDELSGQRLFSRFVFPVVGCIAVRAGTFAVDKRGTELFPCLPFPHSWHIVAHQDH